MKNPITINRISGALAILVVFGSAYGCNSKRLPADAQTVGFVLDVSGNWVCEACQRPIAAGDSLPSGARFSPRDGGDSERKLVVALCTGEIRTFENKAAELPTRVESNRWSRIWSLAKSRYGSTLVSAHARGDAGGKLRDAVVRLEDGKLDLTGVFELMPAGSYRLQQGEVDGALTVIGVHEWEPGTGASLVVEGLKPGIHHLSVLAGEASNRRASGGATILVASPGEFERLANDYRLAEELTSTWPDTVPSSTIRRVLWAILAGLADELATSNETK